ncbi:hemoglobin-like protein [Pseudomethylobacillus aquaticus]|uniref:Hemoglobin-like protein n=1 Tax=Pseudomethylobacillus aquaticus TaxID=2676064 RepID=A0A3N0V5I1_9PROT|nr:group II truncated hemoglobin [Pseudomethylobacillus aquaticus]ROH87935.1 hemoglobin-like protein [Pseudomethylobacillus aquaticus]
MLDKVGEPGSSQATFHTLLGGTEVVRQLVEAFYDIMDADPRAAGVRAMHPADLTGSREKLFMFLTGWSGGPQLYIERYGHPFLRRRHLPFSIGESERDQWMYCMVSAMQRIGVEEAVMLKLAEALWGVADFMRNRPG